ncbi:hypothetical protein K492DRAFT_28055 [Lichtheimia hyalospora FSU 10163]|nr:hypothetical protein K492DRAFT_28055 [Lichtheimia hyalospora FSU 10163]
MLSNDRTPAQDYLKCLLTPNHPLKAVCLRAVLSVFANSSRRCYMPEDYVYGIIGLLSLDIPRMQDPQLVWEAFLQELESLLIQLSEDESQGLTYFSISKKAKTFQLCDAKDMADVYSGVAVMEVNDWNIFMFNMMAVYQSTWFCGHLIKKQDRYQVIDYHFIVGERTDKDFPPEYVAGFIKDNYRNGNMFNYRASKTRFYI